MINPGGFWIPDCYKLFRQANDLYNSINGYLSDSHSLTLETELQYFKCILSFTDIYKVQKAPGNDFSVSQSTL